ncbi:MAG: molybdenum cofactor guanylyltransferase [Oligoflexia bacterium]|nr:molybdenum cofactor guanylyltransferase [Oligoflexia bacterium]
MRILGIVLAGGRSSRMGRDKALLSWQGIPLLKYQIDKLSAIEGIENVCISGDRQEPNSVKDLISGRGPVEGLRSVLSSFDIMDRYNGVLVLPVDMPLLSVGALTALISVNTKQDVVKYCGSSFPLLFRNISKLKMVINQMDSRLRETNSSGYSFKGLLSRLTLCNIEPLQPGSFFNANTPEEWESAISQTNSSS